MKKVIASILVVSITTMQLGGCANTGATQTQQGAAIGAVSGAALGAAVSKNKGKGALIGALIGLLVGAAIGNYRDQQDATRAEAAMKYRYDDRGNKLVVESAAVAPQAVSRGGTFESTVQYTTLSPNIEEQVKLTEVRTLVSAQETIDLGRREVVRPQGTHTSTAKVSLPKDLPKGNYTLVTTISDGKNTKTAKTPFAVV
ncbi:MAG: YMGG-like glycine zipper-containing protein [Candidatus Dechloromonas phosphoritropha]|jgi:outer membrane lipoprotein SlyB|nr:glycine zipper 2TM domain-containing protein [Candidatus Dechloromonas phosphoritropha]MBP9228879.1 glycine zipper 2TM domain-containing protein [Azonexus sp.]